MNNKDYLPLLGWLAIGVIAATSCDENEDKPTSSLSSTDGDKSTSSPSSTDGKEDGEKTVPPVFLNAHSFARKHSSTLDLPDIYRCITEVGDQISPIELTIDTDLPEIPDELPVYKVIRPDVNEDYAVNIAGKLDIGGEPEEMSNRTFPNNGFRFRKDGKTLEVYQDGGIAVYYVLDPDRPSSLPSNEECIAIAREWLEDYGLYPENVISISASPITIYVYKGIEEPLEQFTQNISVSFTIGIDGYETQGMGAYVAVGEDGEIIEAYTNAPEFEKYTMVTLRQPEEVLETFEDYLDDLELFYTKSPLCLVDRINPIMSVTDISLKYFFMLSEDSNTIALAQPILVLKGRAYHKDMSDSSEFTGRVDTVIR